MVIDALGKRGVAANTLTPTGYGATVPRDPGQTANGRAMNRRVDFLAIDRAQAP
jgi:outer membrane protein OmpA-like peptidoglycan-associated protein